MPTRRAGPPRPAARSRRATGRAPRRSRRRPVEALDRRPRNGMETTIVARKSRREEVERAAHALTRSPEGSRNGPSRTRISTGRPSTCTSKRPPSTARRCGTTASPITFPSSARAPRGRDAAGGAAVDDDLTPLDGHRAGRALEADQQPAAAPAPRPVASPTSRPRRTPSRAFTSHGIAASRRFDSESVSWPTIGCTFSSRRMRCGSRPNGRPRICARARAACPRRARRAGSGHGARSRARRRSRCAGASAGTPATPTVAPRYGNASLEKSSSRRRCMNSRAAGLRRSRRERRR